MHLRVELRRDAGRVGPGLGPWIRRKQVGKARGPADPKLLAEVRDHRGNVVGWGLPSAASDIAVRVLSFGPDRPPDDWLERRLTSALDARMSYEFGRHGTTGYREVNTEGDGLPGLVVDRYGDDRVVQLTTAPMASREREILDWLRARDDARTHLVIPATAAAREEVEPAIRNHGSPQHLEFSEYGLRFRVPPPPSQKTGAYLDQRRNRRVVAQLAHRSGGSLLDVGCHVGGFSIHAAALGVPSVGLDNSRLALDRAAANADLNRVAAKIEWVEADMFGELDLPTLAGPFGTVVVDPPRMVSSRRDRDRAMRALERLVQNAMKKLSPGGHLVVCSCSHHLGRKELDATVVHAGGDAWTRAMTLAAGPDHPVWPGHAEGEYLRVNAYQRRR